MKFNRALLVEPGRFEVHEADESICDDEVMVKIASCGLCNWELNFWKGYLNFMGYPHLMGHEFAGCIIDIGKNVKGYQPGDKVSCFLRGFGGFGEYKAVAASKVRKLEESIDPKYALGEPQKCIMTVLRATKPEAGDYGVILGCGPMGLWCIQGLSGNYLAGLIAIDIDDHKLALAKGFGADYTINSRNENVQQRISEISDGRMADWVIEGTGIPNLLNEGQNYLKMSGRGKLVLMSSHEEVCHEFDFRRAIDRSLDIVVAHPAHSDDELDDFRRAVAAINNGTFKNKELVTHEFKLSDINKAFECLENKPGDFLKGIVVPD